MAADEANFTAEDLAHIAAGDGEAPPEPTTTAEVKTEGEVKPAEGAKVDPAIKSIATGADTAEEKKVEEAPKPPATALNDDLRKAIAEHFAAGDKKVYERELRRLERIQDVRHLWGMARELEAKFTSGGLIKLPGKDAKPEDIAAYHKAIGVPEKPEDYFKDVKLENGAVIGELDKPVVEAFAGHMHKVGATPEQMSAALNWYYKQQEDAAAKMDEADETFRIDSERTLKEELGPAFKRKTSAIASLFASAPGGSDVNNENSLFSRLMGGRTADGRLIGNDPDVVRLLISLANEINPGATVVEDGNATVMGVESELAQLRALRTSDPKRYWGATVQARELELIQARDRLRARG